jgi:hypothetical protein
LPSLEPPKNQLLQRRGTVNAALAPGDGKKPDYAQIQLERISEGNHGKVDLVQPFANHSEKGGPERSMAAIVRSERLVGRVLQGRHDAKTDKY